MYWQVVAHIPRYTGKRFEVVTAVALPVAAIPHGANAIAFLLFGAGVLLWLRTVGPYAAAGLLAVRASEAAGRAGSPVFGVLGGMASLAMDWPVSRAASGAA